MKRRSSQKAVTGLVLLAAPAAILGFAIAQDVPPKKSSFSPVVINEPFPDVMRRMTGEKPT